MRKLLKQAIILGMILLITNTIIAQKTSQTSANKRFIEIDNIENLFIFNNKNYSELIKFELHNIFDDESSKPIFISVNDIPNVKKFTIKSSSFQFENQRTCYLSLYNNNYIETFKQVLLQMGVYYIKENDQFITLDEYFSHIK